jgi:hypothetical protein
MRSHVFLLPVILLLVIGTMGCNFPGSPNGPDESGTPSLLYGTVASLLTQTASNLTPSPILTATPDNFQSPSPTSINLPLSSATPMPTTMLSSPTVICDLARAGIPFDVTIPDDSVIRPGEAFVKTWRLVNAGSCTWNRDYALVWFSGDDLGVRRVEPFGVSVAPNDVVDFSVDMLAPMNPGVYQSNWKLRNNRGELFGIGPGGGAPFWVRIQVVAAATPTATQAPPTVTPTAVILASGNITLLIDEAVDLETGQKGATPDSDAVFQLVESNAALSPQSGARFGSPVDLSPSLNECQRASVSDAPLILSPELQGRFLCVTTSRGLPGSVQLSRIDLDNLEIELIYLVWLVP